MAAEPADRATAETRRRLDEELQQDVDAPRTDRDCGMPISRVRSVTDTSMMFMMPMPPTSSDTAAHAPIADVDARP